jgi:hypothetical protein
MSDEAGRMEEVKIEACHDALALFQIRTYDCRAGLASYAALIGALGSAWWRGSARPMP